MNNKTNVVGGCSGRDHMVVGFTTTYAISAYPHWCCEFESQSGWGVQHNVIKFVNDLQQVGGFLQVLWFPPPIKLTATEIFLKVVLNTIKQTSKCMVTRNSFFDIMYKVYICLSSIATSHSLQNFMIATLCG